MAHPKCAVSSNSTTGPTRRQCSSLLQDLNLYLRFRRAPLFPLSYKYIYRSWYFNVPSFVLKYMRHKILLLIEFDMGSCDFLFSLYTTLIFRRKRDLNSHKWIMIPWFYQIELFRLIFLFYLLSDLNRYIRRQRILNASRLPITPSRFYIECTEIRTRNPELKRLLLYQLSYTLFFYMGA